MDLQPPKAVFLMTFLFPDAMLGVHMWLPAIHSKGKPKH